MHGKGVVVMILVGVVGSRRCNFMAGGISFLDVNSVMRKLKKNMILRGNLRKEECKLHGCEN